MEPENRIAEARLSDAETAAVPSPLPAAVGASKDKRELLLVADEISRVRETRTELEMNHHGHIS
jgi:MoxR-like ATPase